MGHCNWDLLGNQERHGVLPDRLLGSYFMAGAAGVVHSVGILMKKALVKSQQQDFHVQQ